MLRTADLEYHNCLDVKCSHLFLECEAINSISISQEIARVFLIVKSLNQLPYSPGGLLDHCVQDFPFTERRVHESRIHLTNR
jgi:hypothetical protein